MWNIHIFDELESTQTYARHLLESGSAKHGDVIQALHQTQGKGRYDDRPWYDEPGANVLVSVIVKNISDDVLQRIQFITGLAIVKTIRVMTASYGIEESYVRLKWVNDVLIHMRKTAGILCETLWSGSELRGCIIGVGMNVNQTIFPYQYRTAPTSFRSETGHNFNIKDVLTVFLSELQWSLERFTVNDFFQSLRSELEWMRSYGLFSAIGSDDKIRSGLMYDSITNDGKIIVHNQAGEIIQLHNATLIL